MIARRPPKTSMEIHAQRQARFSPKPVATPQTDKGTMTKVTAWSKCPISPIGGFVLTKTVRLVNS